MKKCLIIIMLVLLACVVYGVEVCEDSLPSGDSCMMLTPVLDCSTYDYNIFNSTSNVTITSGNLTSLDGDIYYLFFNETEVGGYIVKLCDNSTRELTVEQVVFDAQALSIFHGLTTIGVILLTGIILLVSVMLYNKHENILYTLIGLPMLLLCIWMLGSNFYISGQLVAVSGGVNVSDSSDTLSSTELKEQYIGLSENQWSIYNIFLRFFWVVMILVLSYILWIGITWFNFRNKKDREDRGFG